MKTTGTAIKFSVVMPAYNAEQTIAESLRSCIQQSYQPFEIIVVNDGSTDNTEKIIQTEFKHQVKYISLSKNAGASTARNAGLNAATGDYIAFLDADDTWHPDKLSIFSELISKKPTAKFIFHPYTLSTMDFDARSIKTTIEKISFWKLLWSNPVGTPCVVLINDHSLLFNESMRYMEDYDLFLRAADKNGIYFLPVPLTKLGRPILSAGGLSSNRWLMRKGEFKAYWHLALRNPLYFMLLPFLVAFGLLKHFIKSFSPPRTNY
jgi:teichuronic acid biosynthesis glycosyltransferase TuaG